MLNPSYMYPAHIHYFLSPKLWYFCCCVFLQFLLYIFFPSSFCAARRSWVISPQPSRRLVKSTQLHTVPVVGKRAHKETTKTEAKKQQCESQGEPSAFLLCLVFFPFLQQATYIYIHIFIYSLRLQCVCAHCVSTVPIFLFFFLFWARACGFVWQKHYQKKKEYSGSGVYR